MGFNNRMGRTEERGRELKARAIGITQREQLGENTIGEENALSLRDLGHENKGALTFTLFESRRQRRKWVGLNESSKK